MATVQLSAKAVGSIVKIKENGTLKDYIVLQHGYPGSNGRTLLMRNDMIANQQLFQQFDTNAYLNTLEISIRNNIAEIDLPIGIFNSYKNITYTTRKTKVFSLSGKEIGFTTNNYTWMSAEGNHIPYFNSHARRSCSSNSSMDSYWIRSMTDTHGLAVGYMIFQDTLQAGPEPRYTMHTRPCFTLPSAILVLDSGEVRVNTAPTMPGTLTVPGTIKGGETITVSWSGSSDAESNLAGYQLDMNRDSLGWSQVYRNNGLSFNQAITKGWKTVQFRVKAYDTLNAESAYNTSTARTIINNSPPSVPGACNISEPVIGGKNVTVSWTASTDPDGNLSGYRLERAYNGTGWTQVYQGNALSSVQSIQKGQNTVTFRVRAFDAENLQSDYRTSVAKTIINNTAPTAPGSLSYSDPRAGRSITLTCGASTDPDGDPIQYVWERRVDSGAFIQIGITSATTTTDTVPGSGTNYQVRVKAIDNKGNESGYFTGTALPIRYNDPPVITGSDVDLGDLTATGLRYAYTVTDDKTPDVNVVIRMDNAVTQTLAAKPGVQQVFTLEGESWQRVLNGNHTLTITATDTEGMSAVRTLRFRRSQRTIEFRLKEPRAISDRPYRMALNLSATLPGDSELTVLACNNALDTSPVWEDISTAVKAGRAHIFQNRAKTGEHWAVDIHLTLNRGAGEGDCYISGFTYAYETDSSGAVGQAVRKLAGLFTEMIS